MKQRTLIVGLTGSIGMGKSTVARMFARLGVPVFCADAVVRELLGPDGAGTQKIARLFPLCVSSRGVKRKKLADIIFADPAAARAVEAILHPLVWKERDRFLKEAKARGERFVVYDVPLLFETRADKQCDVTLCVSARAAVQKERVLRRAGMTERKFRLIRARQMPDAEKRKRADIVLRTDVSLAQTRAEVKKITAFLREEGQDYA